MNRIKRIRKNKHPTAEEAQELTRLKDEKQQVQRQLNDLIATHRGTPRRVRLRSVLDERRFTDADGVYREPPGVTWWTLKPTRRIAEFASEASRAMGLTHNEVTFDKIIVKWKSLDI